MKFPKYAALLAIAVIGCAGPTTDLDAAIEHDAASTRDTGVDVGASANDAAHVADAPLADVGSDAGACTTLDCASPACAHATCETLPTDWTGPFALYDGPSASAPSCASGAPAYSGHAGLTAAPATCTACTCDAPLGSVCHLPPLLVADAACGPATPLCLAELTIPDPWTGVCEGTDAAPAGQATCGPGTNAACATGHSACNVSTRMDVTSVTGGSCLSHGGVATAPAIVWDRAGVACDLPTGVGCTTGACVGAPPTPFLARACIRHDGEMACPAGAFSESHVFYADVTDTRACTACECGLVTGSTCTATVRVFSAATPATCTGPIATLSLTSTVGGCANLAGNPIVGSRSAMISTPGGGTCPATGGAATGDATPATATTFCCLPSS